MSAAVTKSRRQFARNLAELMADKRIGKKVLCERAGIGRPTLDAYLDATTSAGLDTITALAEALDVTPARLLAAPNEGHSLRDCLRALGEVVRTLEDADDAEVLEISKSLKPK